MKTPPTAVRGLVCGDAHRRTASIVPNFRTFPPPQAYNDDVGAAIDEAKATQGAAIERVRRQLSCAWRDSRRRWGRRACQEATVFVRHLQLGDVRR